MKKIFGITFGGLQQKILNLVLIFLLVLIAVFVGVSYYQTVHLGKIVGDAEKNQHQSIEKVSEETMSQTIESTLTKTNALQAYIADDMFAEVRCDLETVQTLATGLFEHKDSFEPHPFSIPDPANEGRFAAQVLCEEGVDYEHSEYLGVAAHMTDTMIAMCENSTYMNNFYIGLADGTHLGIDEHSSNKFDENGEFIPFPVRERPWYKNAVEAGGLVFSEVMTDAYTGAICITCSAPVYADGELVGVVGVDLFLDEMEEYVEQSSTQGGFICIISDSGKVIFAPENNGVFDEAVQSDEDIRTSENTALAGFVSAALSESTGLKTVDVNGKEYYMAGTPLETVGWTVISGIEKEITEQPTKLMLDEYGRINDSAAAEFDEGTDHSRQTILVMTLLLLILGSVGAIYVANRIVKPIEKMTNRMAAISGSDQAFEMDDAYRTGDEVEMLAQNLADLSTKTRQYIKDITEITKEKERIGTELELATKIQADMLPNIFPAFPERDEFDIYASMTPAKEVGGDFYDFFLIDDDHLGMVMADVSGKGVPAALFMMMSKILVNNFAMQGNSPAKVLELTNATICQNNDEEMFVTVWFGILEISTGKITAANAGHEYPVIKKANGEFELFKDKHGFVIGGMEGMTYREYEMQLEKGGTLFLYTDGVPEATNSNNVLFGTDRLLEVMNRHKDSDPQTLLTEIKAAVDKFVGEADQFDDLTMLGLKMQ